MTKQKITYMTFIVLLLFCSIDLQAQGTLQKLKFEEAEQAYLNNNYTEAINLLEELEKEGLKNPRVLHLKIMATSKVNITSLSFEQATQFKTDVASYLKNYDIEGLEDKYKEIYQVSKTANSYMYDEGRLCSTQGNKYYTEKNYVKALEWYLKADQSGFKDANMHSMLGYLYQEGQGVEKDINKAIEWYTKAANQGDIYSQKRLGFIYQYGKGVQQNFNKALEWYTKAALQNDLEAMRSLIFIYPVHLKDYDNALLWNQKVIDHPKITEKERGISIRSRASLYNDAGRYAEAIEQYNSSTYMTGIEENHKAFETIQMHLELAGVYERLGEWEKAFHYFEHAFNSIDSAKQSDHFFVKMGLYYYEGKGVEQSYEKAYEYWSWNTNIDVNKIGYGSLLMKAILLYSTKEQKNWGNDQLSLSVDLVKQLVKKTEGSMLKYANQYYTTIQIKEMFPKFAKDKEHFFSYLAKEHNIIFE